MIAAMLLVGTAITIVPAYRDCPPCETRPDSARVAPVEEPEDEEEVELGGSLHFNFHYTEWLRREFAPEDFGDFEFDSFQLRADASQGDLLFSAEYRFYSGYHFLHHGWVGFDPADSLELGVGVHRVPFGALPFASHSYFFQLAYYVGLEDDYDGGARLRYAPGPWDAQLAFYLNDEGNYTGRSLASARYSYDIVPALPEELGDSAGRGRFDEEANQLNARLARTFAVGARGRAEVGLSGQWGMIRNTAIDESGSHWAVGLHADAAVRRWDVKAEVIRYDLDPELLAGEDGRFVVMGAYDAPYKVAAKADLYLIGVAYTVPLELGPVESVQLYEDYAYMRKRVEGFPDSQQNVLGALVTAGPLLVYLDLASGKHHPWLGPDYVEALAGGGDDDSWNTRFNVNIGYYF